MPRVMQAADVTFEGKGEADEIDSLLSGPFHRFSLLAPWAQIAGFGGFRSVSAAGRRAGLARSCAGQ
jgi:hypothetical protein